VGVGAECPVKFVANPSIILSLNGKKDLTRLTETNNTQSATYHMADMGEKNAIT
jgi:hypothetical protein